LSDERRATVNGSLPDYVEVAETPTGAENDSEDWCASKLSGGPPWMRDRALTAREVTALTKVLVNAIEENQRYEDGLPHLLICVDGETRRATYSGPFCSRAEAERVADHERNSARGEPSLTFRTAPLYPPLELKYREAVSPPT